MDLHIGQTISITPEDFKHLTKYKGLVLSYTSVFGNIMYIYYNHAYNNYYTIPNHEFSIRDVYPGVAMQYSWCYMAAGRKYTVVAYNKCATSLKKLH